MTEIPPLVVPAVRIEDIITIMDVMGDVNPIHVDEDLVRELGLRGPVNQGPANLAYIVNMLIAWAGSPESIRHLNLRFQSISCPGDRLEARGNVVRLIHGDDGPVAHCAVALVREGGEVILSGTADVSVTTTMAEVVEAAHG
ncbi:MAG: protein dehydratase [bacterium]|nr:protein dehydratase [bacterium]